MGHRDAGRDRDGLALRARTAGHKGDALLEVETDKIVNSVEAPVSGVLRRILGAPGEVRAVGALIGVFADAEVPESEVDRFIGSFVAPDASFEPRAPTSTAPAVTQATSAAPPGADAESEARVSPIARRLALELGVDLAQVTGTGRNGRVSKQDVEAWAAAHRASPASKTPAADAGNPSTSERISATRATIARRLLESKQQIPHFRLGITVDAAPLVAYRAALRSRGEAVSLNDLIVRACALALVQPPRAQRPLRRRADRALPGRRHLRRGCDGGRPDHAGAASREYEARSRRSRRSPPH